MKWKKTISVAALCLTVLLSSTVSIESCEKDVSPFIQVGRNATSTYTAGYSPAKIKKGYGIDKLANAGAGQTIAIVDAYHDPNIVDDLAVFDNQFGLPAANLTVAYPDGQPNTDTGWALETSLDVEWAHALAPEAQIILVEAKSASTSDLLSAINYANSQNVQVVSMSWGGEENSALKNYDNYFRHSGTVYVASSGDNGAGVNWPACSPYVVSVGGTTLTLDSSGNRTAETAWSGSGGGISSYESEPAWQTNLKISSGNKRAIPDVSFDANPSTGVAVYDSLSYQGTSGWWEVGGTSLSAPAWAGLIAVADNSTPITNADQLLYQLAGGKFYSKPQLRYYDITSGSNGYSARPGYDLVTGLGSPVANKLIPLM